MMKIEELDQKINRLLLERKKLQTDQDYKKDLAQIQENFEKIVEPTTRMGKLLNSYRDTDRKDDKQTREITDNSAELLFCGYLEGDFSERSYLQTPITFSGGFFLKTKIANILFDPGNGTITGLRELDVCINPDIDIIIASHYHPSARLDLHTILNELGGYCPGRSFGSSRKQKNVYLFSTRAVIEGRNDHPSILIPSDNKVIIGKPIVALPNQCWRIIKEKEGCTVIPCIEQDPSPTADSLLIQTFPAFHSETIGIHEDRDRDGLSGREISCYFIETPDYGILFTGDTEYPDWSDQIIDRLKEKVAVLIANMKTIEYLPKEKPDKNRIIRWDNLQFTYNQLGFEGTKRLAGILKPKVLVMRALGLECVVESDENGDLKYAPHKLGIIRKAMHTLLEQYNADVKHVIIPGRHKIVLHPSDDGLRISEKPVVRAFPSLDVRNYGGIFFTADPDLIKQIDMCISLLKQNEKPYIVIQGEIGIGKTLLANAIAKEMVKDSKKIEFYDLAMAEKNEQLFINNLFGYTKGAFTGAEKAHEGFLSTPNGVLILNQFEKFLESKKFLDLLQEWKFHQTGAKEPLDVKVKIIFTTNINIEYLITLTEDIKSRLRSRLITIPSLSDLPKDKRERALSIFIDRWCYRESVILEKEAREMLFYLDLSQGAFRCLNGLLHKAKLMTQVEYGLDRPEGKSKSPVIVFINTAFIEIACKEMRIKWINDPVSIVEGIPAKLVWILAVWLSNSMNMKETYQMIKSEKGKTLSFQRFKKDLADFRSMFKSSEDAWNFFLNTDALDALKLEKNPEAYISELHVIKEAFEPESIFKFGQDSKKDWLEARYKGLESVLTGNFLEMRKKKEEFMRIMDGVK